MNSIKEIVEKIKSSSALDGMTTRIIAIDGLGGAGKSTLAFRISKFLNDAPIIPTDDFASWENPLNWWPRMIEQVFKPLSLNKPAHYQRYDWGTKRLAEWKDVEPSKFLIIEGVSASRDAFRPYLAFSIWVDTPRDERLRRGIHRDGEGARLLWEKWMKEEDYYASEERPREKADLVVSGMDATNQL